MKEDYNVVTPHLNVLVLCDNMRFVADKTVLIICMYCAC